MHQRFPGKRQQQIAEDSIVPGYPWSIGGIDLLGDRLVGVGDGNELLKRLLGTEKKTLISFSLMGKDKVEGIVVGGGIKELIVFMVP
jgi:hypothetical protein